MTPDIQTLSLSKSQKEIADLYARFSEELQNIMRTRGLSEEDKHNITSIAEVINRIATSHIKTADQFQNLTSRRNREAIDQLQYAIEILRPLKEKEFHLAHEQLQQLQEIAEVYDITLSQKNPAKANLHKKANLKRTHPQFIGREAILRKIQAQLSVVASKPIVLYGPPGIGKSELAIAFANANLDKYFVIWTIAAKTKETREKSYKALAEALNLPILEKDTHEDIKKRVHSKLEQFKEIRWLLIYDNLEEFIELPERGGDIIITSRSCELFVLFESIELSPLSESESIILLKQVTREGESEAMHKLAKHFGYYPLVLGQIANYIRLNAGVTIASYLETTPVIDERKLSPNERYKATLQSTFEVIKKTLPPLALKWLQLCAFLHADDIPESFLKIWLEHQREHVSLTKQQILTMLINRGLLRLDSERQIFSIPRLFQKILKSNEGFIETADLLLNIGKTFDFDTIADWETMKKEANQWVLHANQLMDAAGFKSLLKKESQSLLKLIVGTWQTRIGKHSQALTNLIYVAVSQDEKPDSILKVNILNALGVCLWYMRLPQSSLQRHRAAFKIQKNILEADHKDLVKTLKYIGNCLWNMEKPAEALEKYKQALEIQKKASKKNPIQEAHLINNMGNCLYDLGKIDEAIIHYQKALEIREKVLSPNHPRIADSLANIAICFSKKGKRKEAYELHIQALTIYERTLGKDIAIYSYTEVGKFNEALEIYTQIISIRENTLGHHHPQLAQSLFKFGQFLTMEDSFPDRALKLFARALSIFEKSPGYDCDVAEVSYNIGLTLVTQRKYKLAEEKFLKAYQISKDIYGEENEVTKKYLELVKSMELSETIKTLKDKLRSMLAENTTTVTADEKNQNCISM